MKRLVGSRIEMSNSRNWISNRDMKLYILGIYKKIVRHAVIEGTKGFSQIRQTVLSMFKNNKKSFQA